MVSNDSCSSHKSSTVERNAPSKITHLSRKQTPGPTRRGLWPAHMHMLAGLTTQITSHQLDNWSIFPHHNHNQLPQQKRHALAYKNAGPAEGKGWQTFKYNSSRKFQDYLINYTLTATFEQTKTLIYACFQLQQHACTYTAL